MQDSIVNQDEGRDGTSSGSAREKELLFWEDEKGLRKRKQTGESLKSLFPPRRKTQSPPRQEAAERVHREVRMRKKKSRGRNCQDR